MAKIVCYLVANLQCRKWPNIKKTASHTACSALMFIFIRQCTLQNRFLLDLQSGKNVSNTRERERERERENVFFVLKLVEKGKTTSTTFTCSTQRQKRHNDVWCRFWRTVQRQS